MYPDDPAKHVSHETIYAKIYAQPRGELRTQLIKHLRQAHKNRRPRSRGTDRRGARWDGMTPIAERPDEVETRTVAGHWEGDLIIGKGQKSALGTLVERTSRYLIMTQLENRKAAIVRQGFTAHMKALPPPLRKSITYDRGSEMAQHKKLEADLNLTVFFADPYAPQKNHGAARHQRKYQRPHPPISAKRNRPLTPHTARPQRHRTRDQQQTQKMLGLPNTT